MITTTSYFLQFFSQFDFPCGKSGVRETFTKKYAKIGPKEKTKIILIPLINAAAIKLWAELITKIFAEKTITASASPNDAGVMLAIKEIEFKEEINRDLIKDKSIPKARKEKKIIANQTKAVSI